jgi:hypothetical protein
MPSAPKHTGRWFQFSLGTMFLVVTVVAVVLAYHLNWIQQRHAFLANQLSVIRSLPEMRYESRPWVTPGARAPGFLSMFGEDGLSQVVLLIRESDARERAFKPENLPYVVPDADREFHHAQVLFPEAEVVAFAWDRFLDDGYFRFVPITIAN